MAVRSVLPVYALAAFLLIVSAGTTLIGVHDAALADAGIGVTVMSALLLVAALVLALAALDLLRLARRRTWSDGVRPPCRPVALIGFLIAILLNVYVFLSVARTPSPQRPIVASVALVLVAVAVAGLVYFGRDARVTLPRVGTIVLGLIGTIVGAWEFWFQNQYVPSHGGRAVELTVELQHVGRTAGSDVVRAAFEYKDVGRSVFVIGSTYTLTGARVVGCGRPPTKVESITSIFDQFLEDPQRSRFMPATFELQPATVLAAGKFVGDGKRLEPDVIGSRNLVVLVPRGRYQLLRLRAQLFALPTPVQLSQRRIPEFHQFTGDNFLYGFWHIDDDSWLHDLVYGRERWVAVRYELVNSAAPLRVSPDLRVTARFPRPPWGGARPSHDQLLHLFEKRQPGDASEPFADAELALEKAGRATKTDNVPARCRSH